MQERSADSTDGREDHYSRGEPFLAWLESAAGYSGQVKATGFYPPRKAVYAEFEGSQAGLLARLGITPYRHQAEAFTHLDSGADLMVSTATASG